MAILINLEEYADSEAKILIGDSELYIRSVYNTRSSRWYINILDTNRTPLVKSAKMLPNRRLSYKQANLPSGGDFYCIDNNDLDSQSELGFESIKERLSLYWLTDEEAVIVNNYIAQGLPS